MSTHLQGKHVLLTGSTGGIGAALARQLSQLGAVLLLQGRDRDKLEALAAELTGGERARPRVLVADLSALAEVAQLARNVASGGIVDVLVNNAGVGFGRDRGRRETSSDGFELRFAVNYLAPFLLTESLVGRGQPARAVVNVASAGQAPLDESDLMSKRRYDGVLAYRRSKLALVADTFERARRDHRRSYVALHPGTFLATKMVVDAGIRPLGTAEQGAAAVLEVIERALEGQSGVYFDRAAVARPDAAAEDVALQSRLRDKALALTRTYRD